MTTSPTSELYNEYVQTMRRIADIRYASALLQWDQETYLPLKGASIRGQQIATLSEMAHRSFTDDKLGALLHELQSRQDLDPASRRNVELTSEDYDRQIKFSPAFVRQLTETVNKCFHSWLEARKGNDFNRFAPDLAKLIELKKEEATILGYQHHLYDALLNDHDKGSNVRLLDDVFSKVRKPLKEMLDKIMSAPQTDNSFLRRHYPKDKQWAFGMEVIKALGYDLDAGRQDISEHPFTINFNSHDVRITTRIDEHDLGNMVWSCIHETGHALYEQGLPEGAYGLPLGEPASYTIHESQSRLWENHIGRSRAFCEQWFPVLQRYFPEQLHDISPDTFYRGINRVEPSFIRTEADELTYHFHVMVRYDLEKLLLENAITTKDIPAYWNEHYRQYLGIQVPDDKKGCLQDVHWSHGSFGYFPTYSLGSFYAAQFYATAQKALPELDSQIQKGDTKALLDWLRNQVHRHGRMYTSEGLSLAVSGETLNIQHFLDYLQQKYSGIYQLRS